MVDACGRPAAAAWTAPCPATHTAAVPTTTADRTMVAQRVRLARVMVRLLLTVSRHSPLSLVSRPGSSHTDREIPLPGSCFVQTSSRPTPSSEVSTSTAPGSPRGAHPPGSSGRSSELRGTTRLGRRRAMAVVGLGRVLPVQGPAPLEVSRRCRSYGVQHEPGPDKSRPSVGCQLGRQSGRSPRRGVGAVPRARAEGLVAEWPLVAHVKRARSRQVDVSAHRSGRDR